MKKLYVVRQMFLGEGTYFVGLYDNKCQMFKDMKKMMVLCGVDFNDVDEVASVLSEQWDYDTTEVETVNKNMTVIFNKETKVLKEVLAEEKRNQEGIVSFDSIVNEMIDDSIAVPFI